ncbi:MAG: hypothetical protein ACRDJH_08680 [Thermomicrobiales bacterium]
MVAERKSQAELTYEEQVAIARANLERHIAEVNRVADEWEAERGDPAVALDEYVREHFDRDALLEVWQEWRRERGKPALEGW